MKKRKRWTKGASLLSRAAVAVIFIAAYAAALIWVHRHICRIEGTSMEPSYKNGDLIYTEMLSEGNTPAFGDVVILESPGENGGLSFLPWKTLLTKRVVGLPGDLLEVREDGLYRNGTVLEEPFIKSWKKAECLTVELGEDEYFVLGDNRDDSYDSRSFGAAKGDSIKRIVRKIIFRWSSART